MKDTKKFFVYLPFFLGLFLAKAIVGISLEKVKVKRKKKLNFMMICLMTWTSAKTLKEEQRKPQVKDTIPELIPRVSLYQEIGHFWVILMILSMTMTTLVL